MANRSHYRSLLPLSIIAASGAFTTTTAIAAEEEVTKNVERILVTGSRRNDRIVSESSVPVDIINIEDMVTTGQLEVSQVLTTLIPSFSYPNPSIADGTDHSRPAVLRGLAPDHTLVLINGKRRHSSALLNLNGTVGRGSTAVDLNTIPTSAIKSIEVLRDGTAAQYGSDAIASVINIILKDDVGGSLSAIFGFGVENSINTSLGVNSPTKFDNGNLVYEQVVVNAAANTMRDWGLTNDVFVAVGLEYRQENYQIKPGEEASYITKLDGNGNPVAAGGAQVLPGFSPSSAVDDSRHNYAVYVELDTDISDQFNIAYAGRFEDYSDFGSTFTSKLAGRYAVTDELSFRGAISTGFRAPSLAQTSYKSIATVFVDGVPNEVGLFPVDEPAAKALGAKQLKAEESVNATFGFVYEYDDFNLTVDAYHITIDDRIVLSENLSGDAVVNILKSAGELNTTRARYFTNAIDTKTEGLDIVATYDYDLDDYGTLRLSAALNFNETEVTGIKNNPPELSALGNSYKVFSSREIARFERGTPRNKYNLAAMWKMDDISVNLRATRYGEVIDASSNPDNHEVLVSKWITDLDAGYQLTDTINLAVGVNNLFDQYPQDTVSNIGQSNFNQIFPYSGFSAYGADGRFVYARATYTF